MQIELKNKNRIISLNQYANELIIKLKDLHQDQTNTLIYPTDEEFKTSLYDKNYKLIYSTLQNPKNHLDKVVFTNDTIIRYIKNPQEYYIDTQYVVVRMMSDKVWLNDIFKTMIIYSVVFFIFSVLIGYFLVRLFLSPMRDALNLLDRFIKDTTHELNTPVSTIMTNIELIEKSKIEDKYLLKIINRIDIGAKTISNIYDDLTYLILNHKIISKDEYINLKALLEERIEYFTSLIHIKRLNISTDISEDIILKIDRTKVTKLIDNILSNAIKYNKINGFIYIKLEANSMLIEDSGKGIKKENIDLLFHRYSRFDKSIGGFGIGLNIVKLIANEYNLTIKIKSKINKGTKFFITW